MRKTKRLIAIIGVALIMLTPILGLIPPATGRASAAPADTADTKTLMDSYIYLRAVARCIEKAELKDGLGAALPGLAADSEVEPQNAESWKWFSDGETYLGYLDEDDHNGKKSCASEDWMGKAYAIWGLSDTTEAICYSGFKRENQSNGTDARECINGSGNFERDGFNNDARRQFIKNINNQFYGKGAVETMPTMTDAMKYYYYSRSFITLCDTTQRNNPESFKDSDVNNWSGNKGKNNHLFKLLGEDGKTYAIYETRGKDAEDHVTTRANDTDKGFGQVEIQCGKLVYDANKYAAAYAAENKIEPGESTTGSDGGTASGAIGLTSCSGFEGIQTILNWILCPLIGSVTSAANGLENVIAGMLCINEASIFGVTSTCHGAASGTDENTSDAFKSAWNVFRILALGLLVIAGLIMVISQGLGIEIFDAYTIKKTLPRIIVAAIGVTLSWEIMQFLVAFSNGLGIGVRSLIYAPFLESGIDQTVLKGGSAALGILFAAGSWFVLGPIGLLTFIGTGLLAILLAFFVLMIRNIIVILLILAAPVAFAAYVLPNTEKYYKSWWDWTIKALMVFPIITAFIAIGHVFSAVTSASDDSLFANITAFVAYFAPYFMIPLAFRFAGGLMATLGGFANDRSRGMFDRLKGIRKNESEKRMGHYGQQYGNRLMQQRIGAVRGLETMASKDGRSWIAKKALMGAAGAVGGLGDIEERASAIQAAASKRANDQIATGRDDAYRGLTVDRGLLRRGAFESQLAQQQARIDAGETLRSDEELVRVNDETRQYKSLGGAWVDEANVVKGHNEYRGDVGAQQAALSYEMRKAMENDQVQGLSDRFVRTAESWGMSDTQMQGAWIGSGFENQNQHLALKSTKLVKNKDGRYEAKLNDTALLNEMYEKKGSYPLSQMSAHTIDAAAEAATRAKTARDDSATQMSEILAGQTQGTAEYEALVNSEQFKTAQKTYTASSTDYDRAKSVAETFMHNMGGARDDKGVPQEGATQGGAQPIRTVNANGAGHVNEAAYRLAVATGVIERAPGNAQSPGSAQTNPTPNNS